MLTVPFHFASKWARLSEPDAVEGFVYLHVNQIGRTMSGYYVTPTFSTIAATCSLWLPRTMPTTKNILAR